MIFIHRREPEAPAWLAWREKARIATEALKQRVQGGEPPAIDDALYKQAMEYLLELSHGKCAYCESPITTTHPGDVEHFRPKGRIRDHVSGKVVRLPDDSADHPGYWWLAYEWSNLLPSCIDCNRRRWHAEEQGGKGELFPVDGERALGPDDAVVEQPLLLNPTLPGFATGAHLEFLASGLVEPSSPAGVISCRIFALNQREALVAARRQRFKDAKRAFDELLQSLIARGINDDPMTPEEIELRREINQLWEGAGPYGACTREALKQYAEALASRGFPVSLPLQESTAAPGA